MPDLPDILARMTQGHGAARAGSATSPLRELGDFGSNPGALRGLMHVPDGLGDKAPLVVVLHGCTQTAAGYDVGAGWSQLADRHGFALLFPEQQRQNNPNLCFNWFVPEDSRRDAGEPLSIRQMIAAMVARYGVDPARVFVTGLSAGGAMASVMLATYPELFAGGAIVAGLPFGTAASVPQALERMRGQSGADEETLGRLVRDASGHRGPWPTISIWHGGGDMTVHPGNAAAVLAQWRAVHGVARDPTRTEMVAGHPRRVWCDETGRAVIEDYAIAGMGHGTPLDTAAAEGCGKGGPFLLEAGISSSYHICRFWGLAGARAEPMPSAATTLPATRPVEPPSARLRVERPRVEPARAAADGVGRVIEDALRAAGLMH